MEDRWMDGWDACYHVNIGRVLASYAARLQVVDETILLTDRLTTTQSINQNYYYYYYYYYYYWSLPWGSTVQVQIR